MKKMVGNAGNNGTAGDDALPACGFSTTPPSAIVHHIPEFIRE